MSRQRGHIVTLFLKDGTTLRAFHTVLDAAHDFAALAVKEGRAVEATVTEGYYFKEKDS